MRRRPFLFGAFSAAIVRGQTAHETPGTVAYVQSDGLWIRDLLNGRPYRLVSGSGIECPRFSPSGNWITYFQNGVLHVLSFGGGRNVALDKPERGSAAPGSQWSPVRDELLVERPGGLNFLSAGNGWESVTRKITGASLPVAFSPDGSEIAYGDQIVRGRGPGGEPMRTGRLCRLSLKRTESKPQVLNATYRSGKIPYAWSRDGRYLVYWENPDFSASVMADGLHLFRIPVAGGPPVSLGVSTLVHDDMLSFFKHEKIAVSTGGGREEWEEKRIATIHPETGEISYVTDKSLVAVCPAWSPNGTALAYSAAPGTAESVGGGEQAKRLLAGRRIWVTDLNGGKVSKPLTNDSRYRDEEPRWSADGKHILFCRMAHDNGTSLWMMGADGRDAVQLAGPLHRSGGDAWFGYYGYIAWRDKFDWFRG